MYQIDNLENENWKTNGELFVCFAQTPAPNIQRIIEGQPHPDTAAFLRNLLNDSPGEDNRSRLEKMAPLGGHKAVVLIPEFAISMDGWEEVNGYVRSMRRAAIVISGLGYVTRHYKLHHIESFESLCAPYDRYHLGDVCLQPF